MTERITREKLNAGIVKLISQRSTCKRLHVGAIITQDNRIISSGYNGALPDNLSTSFGSDGTCLCDVDAPCDKAVHAEANAIYAAAKEGIALEGAVLYCTHSPCIKCAEAIIQSGIKEVLYLEEYRRTDAIELLRQHGIKTVQIDE